MCCDNGAKIICEEGTLSAGDHKLIEGLDRDLQSGFGSKVNRGSVSGTVAGSNFLAMDVKKMINY